MLVFLILMIMLLGLASRITIHVPSQPTPSHQSCTQCISIRVQILRMVSHLPQLCKSSKACFHRRRRAGGLVRVFSRRHSDAPCAPRLLQILGHVVKFDVAMMLGVLSFVAMLPPADRAFASRRADIWNVLARV